MMKFENIFAIGTLLILAIALYIFRDDEKVVTTIITALVGVLSAVSAFFFTKYTPENKSFVSTITALKEINPVNITNDMK